ncbi:MAG TPA: choice-of-anchor Q domain-containing protein [Rudaea sp.]|nr:choice-of-anchor Q domain-containing protein [Rudaea sp.]
MPSAIGNPAIDKGNTGGCADDFGALLTSDQRGFPRPAGAYCDIGASEAPSGCIFKDGFGP